MKQKTLVTPALPYANGQCHLGHLVEHIQVNTYVRALRMAGDDVTYVCGADSHGTPIEVNARKEGIEPEAFAARSAASFAASFARFHIEFDGGYGSTHTESNRLHAERFYAALQKAGHITTRDVEQLCDPTDGRFLPDRLVKGTCPKCKAKDQYGDSCESCGSTYNPTDLIEPRSVVTGAVPELRSSKHYFFELRAYADALRAYLAKPGVLGEDMRNFLEGWLSDLKDWDISRDGPYFGFKIPGEADKYFYVWLDAPVGYVSLTERALQGDWQSIWRDPNARIVHFIGKDILYFHTLFWPAMLMASGDTLPSKIAVHGMLTVDGVKMSKSRGTFILADDLAEVCDPQALRYYFAAKLTPRAEDIDLSFTDFANRVNADLVNNVVNLLSRTVPQLHRYAGGKPGPMFEAGDLTEQVARLGAQVEGFYRELDFAAAVRAVVHMGDLGNKFLQDHAPWDVAKSDPVKARALLSTALWIGKCCVALLKPIVPVIAAKAEAMLKLPAFTFLNALDALPVDVEIGAYDRLFDRLDVKKLEPLKKPIPEPVDPAAAPVPAKVEKPATKTPKVDESEPLPEIGIEDFAKLELRAGKVLAAKNVEGSDKLISVELDMGEKLGQRHVLTGLRPHVTAEQLAGRMLVVVCNLKPRKMGKFGTSAGMILAAGAVPVPLSAEGSAPGARIS